MSTSIGGDPMEFQWLNAKIAIVVKNYNLNINGRSYGLLKKGDKVAMHNWPKVFINGKAVEPHVQ